jgi:hypothetical protein
MYWLIETEEQFEELKEKKFKKVFLEIVPYHHYYHPSLSEISLIFIKPFIDEKGYMLCVCHNEGFSLDKTLIDALLKGIDEIYVINKKQKLYHLPYKNLYDLTYLMPDGFKYPDNLVYNYFYSKHSDISDLNRIIPITKHYEYCEDLFKLIQKYLPLSYPKELEFLNTKAPLAFLGIERNGLTLNPSSFHNHFDLTHPEYSILGNKIFTEYNLYTTTKRPSNSFNSINFAALPKDNKVRESFVPLNDLLVEFDISAYHPTLAAQLIDFNFEDNVYNEFSKAYDVSYDDAKEIIFKNLYGGIKQEYNHIEFFKKIGTFIDKLWDDFNYSGFIECPVSNYRFYRDKLNDMNPQKLFNYLLQHYETANNIEILLEIHKLLVGKKTKLILYVYDSFLFDVDKKEKNLLLEIQKIFERKKLTIKINKGSDYTFS